MASPEDMSKAQLVEEARSRGLALPATATKASLLAAIKAFDEEDDVEEIEVVEAESVEDEAPQSGTEVVLRDSEVAIRDERDHAYQPTHVLPSPAEWEATMVMARTISATTFVPKAYRGNPEAVVAGILYGREIGLGPMQALQKVHIIDGKPSIAAEEMMAQMRRGGVIIVESESTRERARIKAKRRDTGEEADVEWTIQDAIDAGLTNKDNWSRYCVDMLWARCVGRLCRRLGSDLVGGMVYATEEMSDWDDGGAYGGSGYSTSSRAEEPFDPKKKLLPGAPTDWAPTMQLFKHNDAAIPWGALIQQATVAVYGEGAADLKSQSDKVKREVFCRTANTALRISKLSEKETFLSEKSIQSAFAEMFDGCTVTLPTPEPDKDIPAVVEAGDAPLQQSLEPADDGIEF